MLGYESAPGLGGAVSCLLGQPLIKLLSVKRLLFSGFTVWAPCSPARQVSKKFENSVKNMLWDSRHWSSDWSGHRPLDHTASSPCKIVTASGYFLNEWGLPNLGQGSQPYRSMQVDRSERVLASVNMDFIFRNESTLHLPVEKCSFSK